MFFQRKPESIGKIIERYCSCNQNSRVSFYSDTSPLRCIKCGKYPYQQYIRVMRSYYRKRRRLILQAKDHRMKGNENEKYAYA